MRRKSITEEERKAYRAAWRRKDRRTHPEKYIGVHKRSYIKNRKNVLLKVKEYQLKNRENIVERKRKKYASQSPESRRSRTLQQVYGISQEFYLAMYKEQNGSCAICGDFKPILEIDHCHKNGHIRGLLCGHCNKGIGLLRDNPILLHKAADYCTLGGNHDPRNKG